MNTCVNNTCLKAFLKQVPKNVYQKNRDRDTNRSEMSLSDRINKSMGSTFKSSHVKVVRCDLLFINETFETSSVTFVKKMEAKSFVQ